MFNYNCYEHRQIIKWSEMRKRSKEVLQELEIDLDVNEMVENLSVGKQQMVAIAKALVFDSKLLIMDEPTSTLSNAEVEQLLTIMQKLREKGVSILFVTHKLDEMLKITDRVSVFRDGRYIATRPTKELRESDLISMMVGREVTDSRRNGCMKEDIVLSVRNISKAGNYKNVSFDLHKGEILGITGLVGSGRTETLLALFGLNKPERGEIFVDGKKVLLDSPEVAKKLGIALVPENRLTEGAFLDKSVMENISSANLDMFINRHGFIDDRNENSVTEEYARKLDVRPLNTALNVRNLSGGNQQKVIIAKWLMSEPKIFLVDEPTNGIDVGAKAEIHKLLIELAEQGKSVIIVSSEMLEILALADNVLVMSHGVITGKLSGDMITQENMMSAALGGKGGVTK